jgi:ATP-binding cassette subfamily F protein 3
MKRIEKLETIDTSHVLLNVCLKIPNVEKRNLPAFRCNNLSIGYSENIVASKINVEFYQGDHIAILGDNGQGKTTFMRTIAADLPVLAGDYKWSYGLKIGYYAQHVLLSLNPEDDVYTHLSRKSENSVTRQEILDLAGSFLFRGDDVLKKVKVLSGGEKARLCLAGLLLSKSHVLLLDEPTNHLDFETVEALGTALKTFDGTVFFISHDRTFVNMLATHIIEINNGVVVRYPGRYEEYVYSLEMKVHNELIEDKNTSSLPVHDKKPKIIISKRPDRDLLKKLKIERTQLNTENREVEARLDRHKKEYNEIQKAFETDSSSWTKERYLRYEYLCKAIKEEEERCLANMEKLENINKKIDEVGLNNSK